ncbi:MAG: hypothetical protein ACYTEX_16105 [Planctomycetota bacterium]
MVSELLGDSLRIDGDLMAKLYARHDGNIRDCFRQLYDLYAAGKSLG